MSCSPPSPAQRRFPSNPARGAAPSAAGSRSCVFGERQRGSPRVVSPLPCLFPGAEGTRSVCCSISSQEVPRSRAGPPLEPAESSLPASLPLPPSLPSLRPLFPPSALRSAKRTTRGPWSSRVGAASHSPVRPCPLAQVYVIRAERGVCCREGELGGEGELDGRDRGDGDGGFPVPFPPQDLLPGPRSAFDLLDARPSSGTRDLRGYRGSLRGVAREGGE